MRTTTVTKCICIGALFSTTQGAGGLHGQKFSEFNIESLIEYRIRDGHGHGHMQAFDIRR